MNKVVLMGRLTKDPELRFAAGSGKGVCRFTVAINRQFKRDESDFINCVAFGKPGETISEHFAKGNRIALTGNIRTGSYEAQDGTKRYTTDVVVESFEFIEAKNSTSSNDDSFGAGIPDDVVPETDGDMPF
ncbi:MAG: single-stranded DNA-binding protein [Intestinibacter sp.]|uniref:single-stranded DNA-binding protein n=1 Tax=Intestinibacter sp. TaxID=1965304 RepID=UPI002A7EBCF0|nr:single-stranded DNA-binding protein [Intestinibacter sp.]MDY4574797.1 single-stranded DNA-binding protein [Intestinibacter sp.]